MEIDRKDLTYLILGSRGGANRARLIRKLEERPHNINQMASDLNLNYRTVQHHVDLLRKHRIVKKVDSDTGYGDIYFIDLSEDEKEIVREVLSRFDEQMELTSATGSADFFNRVINQTNEGILILDRDWKVFFSNRSAEKLLGYGPGKMNKLNIDSLLQKPVRKYIMDKIMGDEEFSNIRVRLQNRYGNSVDVNLTMDTLFDDKGKIIGRALMLRDVTRQKRIEDRLNDLIARYRFLFNDTPSIKIILDEKGVISEVNTSTLKTLGYKKKELTNRNIRDLIQDPTDEKRFEKVLGRIKKNKFDGLDLKINSSDGSTKEISFRSGTLIPKIGQRTNDIILAGVDQTGVLELQNRVKEAHREELKRHRHFHTLVDSAPIGVIFVDAPDAKISFANERAREILGMNEDVISFGDNNSRGFTLRRTDGKICSPEELPATRVLLDGEIVIEEEMLVDKANGDRINIMVNAVPIRDEDENIIQAILSFWDITELKRVRKDLENYHRELEQQNMELIKSQQELEQSRNEYSDLFDLSPMGLFQLDEYGLVLDVNYTGADMLKRPRKHILDRPLVNNIAEKDREKFRILVREVYDKGEKRSMRTMIDDPDEGNINVLLMLTRVKREYGEPTFCYLSMVDLSDIDVCSN